jgi:hypothetical protein
MRVRPRARKPPHPRGRGASREYEDFSLGW